jgi:hypothetical protein
MSPVRDSTPGARAGSGTLRGMSELLTKRRTVDLCRVDSSLCRIC